MSNPSSSPSGKPQAPPELDKEPQTSHSAQLVSSELLRAALESMVDSVVITARDGRVLYANPAARHGRPAAVTQSDEALAGYGFSRLTG